MKNELSQIISQSRSLVFFGGAGVSTESGIPDFRSVDGLYNQKYDYPPEQMLSHTFLSARRRTSIASTAIRFCPMPFRRSRTPRIRSSPSWRKGYTLGRCDSEY